MGFLNIFNIIKSEEKIIPYENSNQIDVNPTVKAAVSSTKQESMCNEEDICIYFKNKISNDKVIKYNFSIAHNSIDYTTLSYRSSDLIRVKWSPNVKWIKMPIERDYAQKYVNNSIFESQLDKNEYFWKATFNSEDELDTIYPIILEAFNVIDNFKKENNLDDKEYQYVLFAAKLLANIAGDSENIYYQKKSSAIDIMYKGSTAFAITINPYKKKPYRFVAGKTGKEYQLIKQLKLYKGSEKDFPMFFELNQPEDLNIYTEIIKSRYEDFKQHEEIYLEHVDLSYYDKFDLNT